jgi:hypothetical protein
MGLIGASSSKRVERILISKVSSSSSSRRGLLGVSSSSSSRPVQVLLMEGMVIILMLGRSLALGWVHR